MSVQGISVFDGRALSIEFVDGRIHSLAEIKNPPPELPYLSPGFFDLQVNGFQGSDYSADNFSEQHLQHIVQGLAAAGTTQHLATIISSPQKRMLRNLEIIARCLEAADIEAAIPGIHIEGPYISSEQGPRGAHDTRFIRDPDYKEFEEWQAAAEGRIRLLTLAPERDGAIAFVEQVTSDGVKVALGHTAADPETLRRTVAAGACLSTHLGVGSHLVLPRLRNYVWEQLAADELQASIITDGFHLPASVVKTMLRVKGVERLILVSDVAPIGGSPPGIYQWGNLQVQVHEDGHLRLAGKQTLAGAAFLLDWDLAHFMNFTEATPGEAIRLCTVNPAQLLELAPDNGTLAEGAPANLCLFRYRPGDDRLRIERTIRMGVDVYPGPGLPSE